jgi:hypothetical protein
MSNKNKPPSINIFGPGLPAIVDPSLSSVEIAAVGNDLLSEFDAMLIQGMVAADPQWTAVYAEGDELSYMPVACFAHVMVPNPNGAGLITEIRPMTVDIDGSVVDVEQIEGFLCIAAPGKDPRDVVKQAKARLNAESEASG